MLALVIGFVHFWCNDSDKLFVPEGAKDCASKNMACCLLALIFKAWKLKKNGRGCLINYDRLFPNASLQTFCFIIITYLKACFCKPNNVINAGYCDEEKT